MLGFETFVPLEHMTDVTENPLGWAKDAVLTKEIRACLDSTAEQDFVFAVSVQPHGKYPDDPAADADITNAYDLPAFIDRIFDDEAATEPFVRTFGFEKDFYQEYGYDILDHLPVIRNQVPADTEERRKVLSDWRKMVSKLLIRNYFKPIQDWCRENGIMSIGHIDNDHSAESFITWLPCYAKPLEALRCFDVPGVDVICRSI